MTPQQAGVSAERVLRTCLHCKKAPVKLGRAYCDECFHELLNGDCAAPGCKHEKSALATAPPEQAIPEAKPISAWIEQQQQTTPREMATAREDSWSKLERHTKALAKVQPQPVSGMPVSEAFPECDPRVLELQGRETERQAASAGALSAESLVKDIGELVAYRFALRQVTERLLKYAEDTYPRCPESSYREREEADSRKVLIAEAKKILYETYQPAGLAAHDQKVREPLAAWMIVNSFATGHGDTVEDLLKELKWQIEERNQKVRAALQDLLNACLAADANEELSEFIDGSLLDAAREALTSGAEEKK